MSGDELKTYEDSSESGKILRRKFCPTCGSPILSEAGSVPELLFIKAGTLDDASLLKPEVQVWTAHQLPCGELKADTPKFEGNPPG